MSKYGKGHWKELGSNHNNLKIREKLCLGAGWRGAGGEVCVESRRSRSFRTMDKGTLSISHQALKHGTVQVSL